jgi:hypothetical protein
MKSHPGNAGLGRGADSEQSELTTKTENPGDGALTPKNESIKEAMSLAVDLTKQEITLAMAAIVFSGSLLKVEDLKHTQWLLLSWSAWALSLLLGLIAMGRATSLTADGKYTEFDSGFAWVGMFQQLLLVAGLILFAVFVVFR